MESSHPQPPPVLSEEQLRKIFGLGSTTRQRQLGADEIRHHVLGIQVAAKAAEELVRLATFPASTVGTMMDLRNLDTELEGVQQHLIAARCLVQELRRRVRD